MDLRFHRYLNNLDAVFRLSKPDIPDHLGQEGILKRIQEDAQEMFRLRTENDHLLDELIYSRKPEELNEENVADLREFADILFAFTSGKDTGVAYRVHQLLCQYAELHGDRNLHIRELYYEGLSAFYLRLSNPEAGLNYLTDQVGRYFSEAAAYFDQYEEIPDSDTRGYIIRSMANLRLGPEVKGEHHPLVPIDTRKRYPVYKKYFERVMRVIQSPRYRAMNPDLPWQTYEYSMHMDRTTYLSELRDLPDQRELAMDVMESAAYVYRYQERLANLREQVISSRVQYVFDAARYHAGQITARELVDALFAHYETADPHDFSANGVFMNLRMPMYISCYADRMEEQDQQRYKSRVRRAQDAMVAYLTDAPRNEYATMVSNYLADSFSYFIGHNLPFHERILHFILACHPPTYVHSCMVAFLTRQIFEYISDKAPEMLVGVFGVRSLPEVRRRRVEICLRAYRCGLYHDAGKSMILDAVGIYGRRLLDEEFNKIKLHPQLSCYLLGSYPDLDELAQVALRHHRFWNEQGGYPVDCAPCPPELRLVLDVVTVSDCMDAATDNVGRSYASAKSFDALVEELRRDAGTRYSPAVVRLLDDPQLYQHLKNSLDAERRRVYCDIYSVSEDDIA